MNKGQTEIFSVRKTFSSLAGFSLLGVFPGLLGPLLILWRFNLETDPRELGLFALALNAAILTGYVAGRAFSTKPVIVYIWSALGFVGLALSRPFASLTWLALIVLGLGVGVAIAGLGEIAAPLLHQSPARVANISGALFACGALISILVCNAAYWTGQTTVAVALLGIVPIAVWLISRRTESKPTPPRRRQNVRPLATGLLTMLLFFQIGNEWTLAAWLPFSLIHGMGASPNTAMLLLAIHFVFLLIGRWVAKSLLTVVPHRRFLMTGVALSIVGYVLLATARNVEIATTAVIVIALALGPVFPVAAENMDRELSSSVDRILVAALSGAAIGPCLAGFLCHGFGVAQVMIIPALGSVVVCVIALLIMLEARLMGAVD